MKHERSAICLCHVTWSGIGLSYAPPDSRPWEHICYKYRPPRGLREHLIDIFGWALPVGSADPTLEKPND